jgi:hypothetical protein
LRGLIHLIKMIEFGLTHIALYQTREHKFLYLPLCSDYRNDLLRNLISLFFFVLTHNLNSI